MKIYKDKRYESYLVIDTSNSSILKDERLNGTEVRFLLWMLSMNDKKFNYNNESVSKITGMSTRTIIRTVKRLEEIGYIRKYRTGEKNKFEYEFYDNPDKNPDMKKREKNEPR